MREVKLPSGAILRVVEAPFVESNALHQAVLAELKGVPFGENTGMEMIMKELVCAGFSSKAIEKALFKCMERCLYIPEGENPDKVNYATFDPAERRGDYVQVCMEVATDNIGPFLKSLYALCFQALEERKKALA
jgi:hypothetical protein